jgi:phosphotransferase system HPr-like phosphotransfer protein
VSESPAPADVQAYAERRRAIVLGMNEFRKTLTGVGPDEKYVVGQLAAQSLLKAFNVHDVYIPPDAVPARPGDEMENKYLDVRIPVMNLVDQFLKDPEKRILFVFGGYGSGKSALAARLVGTLPENVARPVYISLRQLKTADDLVRIVQRGDQLARTVPRRGGPVLVILDGLDELPNAMDANEKRLNMLRLLECVSRTDKIIVTVRTSYFRGLDDFWDLFARADDDPLWDRLAGHILAAGQRPSVSALILREFSNNQIEAYVRAFAAGQGSPEDFPKRFFEGMARNDPWQIYRTMARNPLYLFLLAGNEPWSIPNVACFADVVNVFIRYWLQRDVEKGQSRWLLRTQDRRDFMSMVAWQMFVQSKPYIRFDAFDSMVTDFFAGSLTQTDSLSFALDLQTTGIFSCIGGAIYFSLPAFQDYFVTERFLSLIAKEDSIQSWPRRLPSLDQVHLLLGVIESQRIRAPRGYFDAEAYLSSIGVAADESLSAPIMLSPAGILYGVIPPGWVWPCVNEDINTQVRIIMNAALRSQDSQLPSVKLRINTRLGLHARPNAYISRRHREWLQTLGPDLKPGVWMRYNNQQASLTSMLEMMVLLVPAGSTCEIVYSGCSTSDIERLLGQLDAVQESEGVGMWVTNFAGQFD